MKLKLTALMLTSLICMAGITSCGKVETADDNIELKISETTTSVTTTGDGTTTTTGENEETTTETTETTAAEEETTAAEAAAETTAAPTEAPTEAPTDAPTQAPEEKVEFSFDNLLKDAAPVIEKLGTPVSVETAQSCLSNGKDIKIYKYDDVEINCFMDGADYIYSIDVKGGDLKTDKGIGIGSTKADVEAAYGTGEPAGGDQFFYSANDGMELDVTYEGDIVTSYSLYVPV